MKYARDLDDLGIECWYHGQESRSGETYSLLLMPCLVVVTLGPSVWCGTGIRRQWRPNHSPHRRCFCKVITPNSLRPLCQYVMNDLCHHSEFLHEFGMVLSRNCCKLLKAVSFRCLACRLGPLGSSIVPTAVEEPYLLCWDLRIIPCMYMKIPITSQFE